MHPRQLAIRLAQAHDRIKAATLTIGELSGIEAPNFQAIPAIGGPAVVRMKEAEMLADYLEALLNAPSRSRSRRQSATPPVEANGGSTQGNETQGQQEAPPPAPSTEGTPPEPATAPDVVAVGADNEAGTDGQPGTGLVPADAGGPPVVDTEPSNASA